MSRPTPSPKKIEDTIIALLDEKFPGVPELPEDIEQFMEVARAEHWITLE